MTTDSMADELRRVQFLSGLSDTFRDRLTSVARTVSISAGGILFRQGDFAKEFHVLLDGIVSLEICAPGIGSKRILTVESGELIGWSPVLGQPRMTATARAATNVRLVSFDSAGCLSLCETEPRFGYELMKCTALALAKRLNATRLQLVNVYGDEMPDAPKERIHGTSQ